MSIVKERKEFYLQQKKDKENNATLGFPIGKVFPKFGSVIPAIPKGYQILLTAGSGIGKTQHWIGIFLFSVYILKKHDPNFKVKFVIALLEDSKEMLIDRLVSMMLFYHFGIKADMFTLHSLRDSLSQDIVNKLDFVEKEIEGLLESCEIADSIYNATGLYKWMRALSNKWGTHHNKTMDFVDNNGGTYKQDVYSHYTPNDPNEFVFVIMDNMNNLALETHNGEKTTQLESLNLWSRSYCRLQITKHWKWTVLNIIQQSAESERPQYDQRGRLVIDKVKPSLDGLGNSRECQRDHFLILGIFSPSRFGITEYSGYNTERLGNHFRSIIILKSNLSDCNIEMPLLFDGGCSLVRELDEPDEITEEKYQAIEQNKIKLKQIKL